MKRLVILLVLTLTSMPVYAQDNVFSELISTSTAREFLLSKKFKTKEYYELGRAKDLIFNALIMINDFGHIINQLDD